MIGAYITFLVAVAIAATYILIVHHFLRSAEEPEDIVREQEARRRADSAREVAGGRPQYAH